MSATEAIQNLKEDQCPVDTLLKEVSGHPCKACGKCVYGYEGASQLEMILSSIIDKKGRSSDLALMKELCGLMKTQSMCDDGIELAGACELAFDTYQKDFEDHISKKACRAGVCKKFMTYHILPDKCIGCGDCIDACEDEAILGRKKFIHVIDQGECTQCGQCVDACEEEAIVLAGAVKPRCPVKPIPCRR